MTTIETLQSQITALQAQLDALKTQPGEWPQVEDWFFCVIAARVDKYEWRGDGLDKSNLSVGNVYRTGEEAQREVDRRKLIHELRVRAKFYKPVFDGQTSNWYLYFHTTSKMWAWYLASYADSTPASGYFAERDETLIADFGDRLNLLRCEEP